MKCLCWCAKEEVGELVQLVGEQGEDCLEVCLVVLVVAGGSYVWCLVIVVIFIGFGGAKKWEDASKASFGVQCKPQGGVFLGKRGFSLCNTTVFKL